MLLVEILRFTQRLQVSFWFGRFGFGVGRCRDLVGGFWESGDPVTKEFFVIGMEKAFGND